MTNHSICANYLCRNTTDGSDALCAGRARKGTQQ